jgi:cyclohexanecarboxylate-CoA ligase
VKSDVTLEHLLVERSTLVVDGERRIDDLGVRAGRLAAGMQRAGVRQGDSVALQLGNTVEMMMAYRACWRLGARAVALHHRFASGELDPLLELVQPVLTLRSIDEVDALVIDHLEAPPVAATPDDDAVVLFTAGSTGPPKGVRHTHRALAYKAQLMVEVHGLTADDVVLMPAPLAHISGLLNGVLVAGVAGMTTVLQQRWSPADALRLIEVEGVSFMIGPPTFFVDLMDAPDFRSERVRVQSLRLISSGGAGVATAFVERAEAELGAVVKRSYGSTEAPTVATSLASDDPDRRRTSDGHAIGDARLMVSSEGELLVRGPELFAGYLSQDQTREAVDADGWFRTGDLADIDDDGWLTIVGRIRDIIIRAGENISILEVEEVLRRHPDIVDAAAVGLRHERLGEQVAVAVVTERPFTVEDCKKWFVEQGLAPFKSPEVVAIVSTIPMLPTGKVNREGVRRVVTQPHEGPIPS